MAVNKIPANSTLRMELRVGTSTTGNPVYRNKNLNNVKSTASDQDLFDVTGALVALQAYPLNSISRADNAQLVEA